MTSRWLVSALLASIAMLPARAAEVGSYGYLRQVEGSADLVHASDPDPVAATANYPIQVGDELRVGPDGRLEAVLPDHSLLRLEKNTRIRFARLVRSLDSRDTANLLQLGQGEIQIQIAEEPVDATGSRVETANAIVDLLAPGSYRVFSDGRTWTQVVVRTGLARIATDTSSTLIESGGQLSVEGTGTPRIDLQAAQPPDELERWGNGLTRAAAEPLRHNYVAPDLAYAAAPLARHGAWTLFRGSRVWRPRVPVEWRPYQSGWWVYTPSGLTWISTEPWGWVTYHYGTWDNAPGIGWVWYPGSQYTPGAVHWYWSPSLVGWAPLGLRPPLGPIPGSPYWTFCPWNRFGYRDSYRHLLTGSQLADSGRLESILDQGRLATDSRDLTPDLWNEPDRLQPRPLPRSRQDSWRGNQGVIAPPDLPFRRDARSSRSLSLPGSHGASRPGLRPGVSGLPRPGAESHRRPGVGRPDPVNRSSFSSPGSLRSDRSPSTLARPGSSRPGIDRSGGVKGIGQAGRPPGGPG